MLTTSSPSQPPLRPPLERRWLRTLSQPKQAAAAVLGNSLHRRLALLVAILCCLSGAPVHAQESLWEQHLAPKDLVPTQLAPATTRNASVERAIRIVRRETGGRVLAASAGTRKGRAGVNVRTLLDGERVTTFFVHADGRLQKR